MSWDVEKACTNRKFGSATRKQVIMFLADKASDDGSAIWCSKGTIQRHTELGETTVKRTVREFLAEGILVKTGSRTCRNGFTVVYQIDLAKVEALDPIIEPEIETLTTVAPVQTGSSTGTDAAGVPGQPRPPNYPETTHKPPTHRREAIVDKVLENIFAAYPSDRLRDKAACITQIKKAIEEGVRPDDLLQAVQAYTIESENYTRSKVCLSDNWFRSRRWHGYITDIRAKRDADQAASADHHARLARWISERSPMCKHISAQQLKTLLALKLVTRAQIQAAGLET